VKRKKILQGLQKRSKKTRIETYFLGDDKMESLKCKFDIHKWKEDKASMEDVCERCRISYPNYARRNSGSVWFCSLRVIRSSLSRLWIWLRGPDKKYSPKGTMDPFYTLSKWTIVGRVTWKLLVVIGIVFVVLT